MKNFPETDDLWVRRDDLDGGRTLRQRLERPGGPLSWEAVLRGWRDSEDFRERFSAALAAAPYKAFFWETPPVSLASRTRPFEWVLVAAEALAGVQADPTPFSAQLGKGQGGIAEFANLSGDAHLIVPRPGGQAAACAHLADFVRSAPRAQVHALWRAVGTAVEARLARSPAPCWVSTSGLGVAWVHVRLDAAPKYVTHPPYRRFEPC